MPTQVNRLKSRYGNRPLAEVQAVDMREVFKRHGKQQTFSDELKQAISETYERKEQAIILLNRRGFFEAAQVAMQAARVNRDRGRV